MEQNKVNTFAAKFKKAFSEAVLNELGKATRYCHRVRQLTPYRMVMTLMALLRARGWKAWRLQRGFNALFGYAMDYKPSTTSSPSGSLPVHARDGTTVVGDPGDPCARRGAGRRLLGVSPHRHPGWQLFRDQGRPERGLSGTVQEGEARGGRIACDLGPLGRIAFQGDLDGRHRKRAGRAAKGLEPRGLSADGRPRVLRPGLSLGTDQGGGELRHPCPQRLESQGAGGLRCARPAHTEVRWQTAQDTALREAGGGGSARALEGPGSVPRMPPHRHMEFLDPGVSILGHQPPAERYSIYEVAKAYRLRWQVELLFKERKSYANLHASIPKTPPSSKGSSGRPSAPLR